MQRIVQTRASMEDTLTAIRQTNADHKELIDAFHRLFYNSPYTHGMTFYEGVPTLKNPLDLWVYQEAIWDLRPTLIIECGTAMGGSALFFARQLDRLGMGMVLTIDIDPIPNGGPQHKRITYLQGSSIDPQILRAVKACASTHPRVMVILDSDHSKAHVLAELAAYGPLVSRGQLLVVEDTNINGRPVDIDWSDGSGPGPAVDEWLPTHPEFEQTALAERYMVTFHTWLHRVRDEAP